MKRTADQIADELLVLGSQAGDTNAWQRLVQRWHPRLLAQAQRLAGTPEGAADITQESWLAIVRSLRRLDDPARFRYWAHRIVANKSADWVRRQQRHRKLIHTAAQRTRSLDDSSPADEALRKERVDLVRQAIRRLPTDQRKLLALFYIEGKSIKQIASRLGIPQGTVKSRLHAIRQELKAYLEETGR